MAGQQSFKAEQEVASILENLDSISNEIKHVHHTCSNLRKILDEGTYKLDSIIKIINNVKTKEEEIKTSGGDPAVLQQINEEQIDNLLEMLKTPAFQKIARQLLSQYVNTGGK